MKTKIISVSADGQRQQVVRHLRNGKKLKSRTFHLTKNAGTWRYMKTRPVFISGRIMEPAEFEAFDFGEGC